MTVFCFLGDIFLEMFKDKFFARIKLPTTNLRKLSTRNPRNPRDVAPLKLAIVAGAFGEFNSMVERELPYYLPGSFQIKWTKTLSGNMVYNSSLDPKGKLS